MPLWVALREKERLTDKQKTSEVRNVPKLVLLPATRIVRIDRDVSNPGYVVYAWADANIGIDVCKYMAGITLGNSLDTLRMQQFTGCE